MRRLELYPFGNGVCVRMQMIEPPNDPKSEAVAATVKGLLAAVPFAGGALVEFGNLYLNPLERRKQRWMVEVSSALNAIQERFALMPEKLQENEEFVSFLFQATLLALKNHQREKLEALRNAVVTFANPAVTSGDVGFQYLRFVDELSATHLAILSSLSKHTDEFAKCDSVMDVYTQLCALGISLDLEIFRSFLHDLDSRFLIRIGDLEDLPELASRRSFIEQENSSRNRLVVTTLGHSFLAFIQA